MTRDVSSKIKTSKAETAVKHRKMRKRVYWQSTFVALIKPHAFFSQLRGADFLWFAIILQLSRWTAMSCITMPHFYLQNPPVFFPVPFGIDQQAYRFFEIFAYFPYGLIIIAVITCLIWHYGKQYATVPMPLSKVSEVIAIAYFTPWLPTLILDNILLSYELATPIIIVPIHIGVVGLESSLTAIGLQQVFGIPREMAWKLGIGGGVIFLALAGVAVR